MPGRWLFPGLVAAGGLLALVAVAAGAIGRPALALAVPVALAMGAAVVRSPFLGLFAVVLLTQLDSFAQQLLRGLPLTAIELVTLGMILGLALDGFRPPAGGYLRFERRALQLVVLFELAVLLSLLFADNKRFALIGTTRLTSYMLLLYLIVRLTRSRRQVKALLLAFLVATAVSGSTIVAGKALGTRIGTSQQTAVERRAGASARGPVASSHMLLSGSCLAALLALRLQRWRPWCVPTALVGLAGAVFTLTRSAGLIAAAAFLWVLFKHRRHRHLPAILGLALAVGFLGLAAVPDLYWKRFSTLAEPGADPTLGRRFGYHLIGLDLLASHPLVGVGANNFNEHYTRFEYRLMPGRFRLESRSLHNMYLAIATEQGLLGFACFAGLLWVALGSVHRARARAPDAEARAFAESIEFAFVVYLLCAFFAVAGFNKFTWVLIGLVLAVARLAAEEGKERSG